MERTVVVNVEFLKSCSVSMDQIRIPLSSNPSTFSYRPKVLRAAVQKAKDQQVIRAQVASFSGYGVAFSVSIEKVKKIAEGLVATGKFDIASIVHYPFSLRFSFEKRYELRMRILRILESRNLIQDWPTLGTLTELTDAEFFNRFVSPYSDHLSDACIPKLR